MNFPTPLIQGTLIKRYKRFLADIRLADGTEITAHCPNTGTMLGCSAPGSDVCLSLSTNPKRKYAHTLEMVRSGATWVGVNTGLTNRLVEEAICTGAIAEFSDVERVRREVKISEASRLDLEVSDSGGTTLIEVKNCSLAEDGVAMFPDAVTARGTKHLEELVRLKENGVRSCIFFLVQRMDADLFRPASHIDPLYAQTLRGAVSRGVELLAYQAEVTPHNISVIRSLPSEL